MTDDERSCDATNGKEKVMIRCRAIPKTHTVLHPLLEYVTWIYLSRMQYSMHSAFEEIH